MAESSEWTSNLLDLVVVDSQVSEGARQIGGNSGQVVVL